MDCSLSGSSFHGIFQARVLEWIAISFSRGSSQPRNWTRVFRIAGRHFTVWATCVANHHKYKQLETRQINTLLHYKSLAYVSLVLHSGFSKADIKVLTLYLHLEAFLGRISIYKLSQVATRVLFPVVARFLCLASCPSVYKSLLSHGLLHQSSHALT